MPNNVDAVRPAYVFPPFVQTPPHTPKGFFSLAYISNRHPPWCSRLVGGDALALAAAARAAALVDAPHLADRAQVALCAVRLVVLAQPQRQERLGHFVVLQLAVPDDDGVVPAVRRD